MGEFEDRQRAMRSIATEMYTMASKLDDLLSTVRQAREALSNVAPDAVRYAGFEGSVEEYEAAAAEEIGFGLVEEARRRILSAVREPFDDVPTS